jgi:hypothetical protein
MQLRLKDQQLYLLREILDSAYRDLTYEINSTDSSGFREQLIRRRDMVRSMLVQLGGPIQISA